MMGFDSAAIVTIKEASRMTRKGRSRIAAWLRQQAAFLEECGAEYSKRFVARYLYDKKGRP